MSIWKNDFTLAALNEVSENTMVSHLKIEFVDFGDDFLTARMPVFEGTVQPMRILHGGASCVLAETVGSVATHLCIDHLTQYAVGLELNASHLGGVAEGGWVYARATPARLGGKIHVWNIALADANQKPVCATRLTMFVAKK